MVENDAASKPRPIRIDTHVHSCRSTSSDLSLEFLIERCLAQKSDVFVCTDIFDDRMFQTLRDSLPSVLLIPALELEMEEGHILVYSTDAEYIHSLCCCQDEVNRLRRDDETAIVWAHPCVTQREDISKMKFLKNGPYVSAQEEQIAKVAHSVDGLEMFNGTMLSLASSGLLNPVYFSNLKFLAERFDLALMGGSDAHDAEMWARAWTEFPAPIRTAKDFIRAIKNRQTQARFDSEYFKTIYETDLE